MPRPVSDQDLPALYQAADHASLQGQRLYLRLVQFDLSLLVVAAVLSAFQAANRTASIVLGLLVLLALVSSIVMTLIIKERKPEQEWYGGRAIAESVKSLSWKYMTGAEPFLKTLTQMDADAKFSQVLLAILENKKDLSWEPGGHESAKPQITETMRHMRDLPLANRKEFYLQGRIQEQALWYSAKAAANRGLRSRWFYALMASQAAAIVFASAATIFSWPPLGLVGVITSLAASLLAWMQVKQFQELSQSYSVAAHELGLISSQIVHKNTEAGFASFVHDAETGMSREHTLWAARRGHS